MRRHTTWLFVVGLLAATTAQAYVLPAGYLLGMLADKRQEQKIEDLSIQLTVERAVEGDTIEEHLFLQQPMRARRVEDREGGRVYVESGGKRAVGSEAKLEPQKGPLTDLTATLFVPGSGDDVSSRLVGALAGVGVDTKITSFGRDGESPVYIIGARAWETDRPQLWLDKSSLLPLRLIASVTEGGTKVLYDTRMREYGSAVAGNWFPRVIEQYRDGELLRRAEVVQVRVNQDLPATLFQLP